MEQDFYEDDEPAGFWLRFAASIIDGIVISIATYLMIFILGIIGLGSGIASGAFDSERLEAGEVPDGMIAAIIGIYLTVMIVGVFGGWLYHALMESSPRQATLGKKAVGIIVTDLDGNRISFGKASARYFSKILSALIMYIGFIMAGFTKEKQALHDMLAGTLVVKE